MDDSKLTPVNGIYASCPLALPNLQDQTLINLIRVLELFPSRSKASPLRARLVIERLSETSGYEAVSYTWGGGGELSAIQLECGDYSTAKPITANLNSALRQFRWKRRKRRLWVDALCINQEDNVEKAAQVRLMGSIYKRAVQVLVWLGPSPEDADRAFEDINALIEIAQRHNVSSRSDYVEVGYRRKEVPLGAIEGAFTILQKGNWRSLFSSTWWTRLWIVQELTLGKNASISWGHLQLNWEALCLAFTLIETTFAHPDTHDLPHSESFWNAWHLVCIRTDYRIYATGRFQNGNPLGDLIQPMYRLRLQDCTDDRDRIFALLGLQQDLRQGRLRLGFEYPDNITDLFTDFAWAFSSAEESDKIRTAALDQPSDSVSDIIERLERSFARQRFRHPPLLIEPNYESSVTDVFTDFAWAYLEAQDEDILQACGLYQHTQTSSGPGKLPVDGAHQSGYLPSWVPDFRKPNKFVHVRWNGGDFRAGKDFLPKFKLSSANKQIAGIHGVIFDKVKVTLQIRSSWPNLYEALEYFCNVVQVIRRIATVNDLQESYLTGGTFDEALARTLVADGYPTSTPRDDIAQQWVQYKRLPHLLSEVDTEKREKDFQDAYGFHKSMLTAIMGHTFFFTEQGRLGLAPSITKVGDQAMLIDGAQTPFVIRKLEGTLDETFQQPYHLIIGPAYVHGVMYGESSRDGRYNNGWGYIPFV